MSHMMALVELRSLEPHANGPDLPRTIEPILVEEALEAAMRPYYSDCSGGYDSATEEELPQPWACGHKGHRWDWYEIGGRYTDFFQAVREPSALPFMGVSAAARYNRSPVHARFGGNPNPEPEPERTGYDVILKRDVDWEAMAAHKMQRAAGWWDEAQPMLAAGDAFARYNFDITDEDIDRDTYIRRRTKDRTYTVLTADGQWVERETFIYVPDGESRFERTPDWDRVWDEMVSNMPGDATLVIVDYHS